MKFKPIALMLIFLVGILMTIGGFPLVFGQPPTVIIEQYQGPNYTSCQSDCGLTSGHGAIWLNFSAPFQNLNDLIVISFSDFSIDSTGCFNPCPIAAYDGNTPVSLQQEAFTSGGSLTHIIYYLSTGDITAQNIRISTVNECAADNLQVLCGVAGFETNIWWSADGNYFPDVTHSTVVFAASNSTNTVNIPAFNPPLSGNNAFDAIWAQPNAGDCTSPSHGSASTSGSPTFAQQMGTATPDVFPDNLVASGFAFNQGNGISPQATFDNIDCGYLNIYGYAAAFSQDFIPYSTTTTSTVSSSITSHRTTTFNSHQTNYTTTSTSTFDNTTTSTPTTVTTTIQTVTSTSTVYVPVNPNDTPNVLFALLIILIMLAFASIVLLRRAGYIGGGSGRYVS